eukprot:GHVU01192793.1.p2 GENE.GHVU01192793.1~~GHVU01192793.1.p2  ORF type:complete len:110 (-),score=8.95 GHVU01192793.1:270-599(-)
MNVRMDMCLCVWTCVCGWMDVCVWMCVWMDAYVCVCVCVRMDVCAYGCLCAYGWVYMRCMLQCLGSTVQRGHEGDFLELMTDLMTGGRTPSLLTHPAVFIERFNVEPPD